MGICDADFLSAHSRRIASAVQILRVPEKEDAVGSRDVPRVGGRIATKRSHVSGSLIAGAARHRILLETERLRVWFLADGL
jgi:hypothetical protein